MHRPKHRIQQLPCAMTTWHAQSRGTCRNTGTIKEHKPVRGRFCGGRIADQASLGFSGISAAGNLLVELDFSGYIQSPSILFVFPIAVFGDGYEKLLHCGNPCFGPLYSQCGMYASWQAEREARTECWQGCEYSDSVGGSQKYLCTCRHWSCGQGDSPDIT